MRGVRHKSQIDRAVNLVSGAGDVRPNDEVVTHVRLEPGRDVLALPPEFLAWIETLGDEEIQNLLALSDAELGALIAGTSAPESSVMPVDGLPTADTTPTLHGINVGTSLPPSAAGPNVVNTVFHIDPNAPPPTATTLEFTNGQQQGPLVTTLQNPVQPHRQ